MSLATEVQVTVVQIDNYGPWTVTPSPGREMDLQNLQSRLYADLAQLVGTRGGYVFFTRFDNTMAVTNGVGRGRTAGAAGTTAKEALERCRESGTAVEVESPAASGER